MNFRAEYLNAQAIFIDFTFFILKYNIIKQIEKVYIILRGN